jgi:hypothetical protein
MKTACIIQTEVMKRRRRFFAHRCSLQVFRFLQVGELRKLVIPRPWYSQDNLLEWYRLWYSNDNTTTLTAKAPLIQVLITVTESKWEANLDDSGIFLPALDKGPTKHFDGETKDELPSTSDTTQLIAVAS